MNVPPNINSERENDQYPLVSIVIVNWNQKHHMVNCLPTLYQQNYPNFEVLVSDNGSTDGSTEYLHQAFPQVKVISNGANLGYAGGNNIGFSQSKSGFIVVLNPDTKVDPDWLFPLVDALQNDPHVAMATPKILIMDTPNLINACGNQITYTGLTFCRGLTQPSDRFNVSEFVSAISGAAFMIKREVLDRIGGFDESFFLYYEDTDFSLRALLAGYRIVYVPESIIYHAFSFRFTPLKCFYQERNRYFSLIKNLRWGTLILFLPSLIFSELISWGYIILKGNEYIKSKIKSYGWLISHLTEILQARRTVQALRKVKDRDIIIWFDYHLAFSQTVHPNVAKLLELVTTPVVFLLGWAGRLFLVW